MGELEVEPGSYDWFIPFVEQIEYESEKLGENKGLRK